MPKEPYAMIVLLCIDGVMRVAVSLVLAPGGGGGGQTTSEILKNTAFYSTKIGLKTTIFPL